LNIVLLGTGAYPVELDGARSVETSIFMLAQKLQEKGHWVRVVDNVPNYGSYTARVLSFSYGLLKTLCNIDADIIQSYAQFPTIAAKMAVGGRIPVFHVACSPHLVTPSSITGFLKHTIAEKQALRKADRVVIHTPSGIDTITSRYGISRGKVAMIPAGVDMSLVRDNDPVGKVILCPGVVTPRKNQMTVVKAMPKVLEQHPDALLLLAGPVEDTGYHRRLLDTASVLGVDGNIRFTGQVSREKMFRMYSEASVMVFPTTFEMQGIVLVEAMACGLPVVASNIDVIRDVAGYDGVLLCNPDEPDTFGTAVSTIQDNMSLRKRLANAGKEIAKRYSWERIAEDFEKEYTNCCIK